MLGIGILKPGDQFLARLFQLGDPPGKLVQLSRVQGEFRVGKIEDNPSNRLVGGQLLQKFTQSHKRLLFDWPTVQE